MGAQCFKDGADNDDNPRRKRGGGGKKNARANRYASGGPDPEFDGAGADADDRGVDASVSLDAKEFAHALVPEDEDATSLSAGPFLRRGKTQSIFVGGEGGQLSLVEPESGAVIQTWGRHHTRDIVKLLFHNQPDNQHGLLFSSSRDKSIKLLRMPIHADGSLLLPGESRPASPNDNKSPTRGGPTADGDGFSSIPSGGGSQRPPRGQIPSADQVIAEPPVAFAGHTLVVTAIAVSPDGRRLFSGSRDNTCRLWDVETQKQLTMEDVKLNVIHCSHWLEEMGCVAQGGEDLTVRLWDIRTKEAHAVGGRLPLRHTLSGFDDHPICMAKPDDGSGHTIVTGHSGFNGKGCAVKVWDLRKLKSTDDLSGHQNTVRWICAPDSKSGSVFTASDDETVREWSVSKRKAIGGPHRVRDGRITSLVELQGAPGAGKGSTSACPRFAYSCRGGAVAATSGLNFTKWRNFAASGE